MAEENVQKLLDMLYEMIDEAKNAPLSNDKCVLNRDEALDLLDEIRAQMPVELKRAQELVRARDEYVEAAKRDVERMNPETRRLIKVMPEDAEATAQVFDLLLGDNLQGRKDHIAENGYKYLELADIS